MRKFNTCEFRVQSRGGDRENCPPEGITKPGSSQYGRYSRSRKPSSVAFALHRDKSFLGVGHQPTISITRSGKSLHCGELEKLPARLKVAFTEHMYLLSENCSPELLSQSFSVVVARVVAELKRLQQELDKVTELQNKNQQLQARVEELSRRQQVKASKLLLNCPNLEAENMRLLMENSRLGALNQSLIKKFGELTESTKVEITECHYTEKSDDQQLEELHDRIKYLTLRLANEESNNFVLIKKTEDGETHHKMVVEALQDARLQLETQERATNQWRERAMMQREDSDSLSWRQYYLVQSIKKLTEVNKKLMSSILSTSTDKSSVSVCQRTHLFQYEVDFFKGIRSMYEDNRQQQYKYSLKGRVDELGLQFDSPSFDNEYNRVIRAHEIYLPQFSFYRPSFYKFIQDQQRQTETVQQSRTSELSRSFVQKMRCIMLSKLNEFMVEENVENYSRFPEFVYTWFDRYDFDTDSNEITVLQLKEDKSTLRRFYHELMNVKLDQSWEVIVFREFLLEELNLEQLYFYLQCQNLLFRRAGITRRLQLLGQLNVLAEYNAAKAVLDIILSEFDTWNITFVTSKLNEKVMLRNGLEYIDSAFFLRCLLEYYKIERTNRLKLIKKMHEEICGSEGAAPTFQQFMRILDRFTELPVDVKTRLYRSCYSVGRGIITPEIIFTVCTQERVFLKYLRIKTFYKLPIQIPRTITTNSQETKVWVVQPCVRYLEVLFAGMRDFLGHSTTATFWGRMLGLGVHQLTDIVDTFRRYFHCHSRSNFENSVLKGRHFIHWLGELGRAIRQVSYHNLYEILEEADKKSPGGVLIDIDENEIGEIYLEHLQAELRLYQRTTEIIAWKKRVYAFRLNSAAKKIQRQVRSKFIKPYMDIYNIMFEKVKKLRVCPSRKR